MLRRGVAPEVALGVAPEPGCWGQPRGRPRGRASRRAHVRAPSMRRLTAVAAGVVALLTSGGIALGVLGASAPAASAIGSRDIPPQLVGVYRSAARTCPGLPWTVLAAIGRIESDHGRSSALGVDHGTNAAGAGGPMQFLASTWQQYGVDGNYDGRADRYDVTDAIYGAARYLCANGGGRPPTLRAAIFAYNHSDSYVDAVLRQAASYTADYDQPAASGSAARAVLAFAVRQIGVPYLWGGTGEGGFDCSGLTQAAYEAAGEAIPRTSEQQWLALPQVPTSQLRPGDLVFFNPGEFAPGLPGHVGIYIGNDQMIDAPHRGALVRIEAVATFGRYIGAARPPS
jgi:cell wall-associated NlpC family hydrolase